MHAFLYASAGAAALMIAAASPAQTVRTTLPIPPAPFDGVIAPDVANSRPMPVQPVRAPAGAPNVLLFMSDDVGFAMSSAFGGPVPTPNFERLAAMGQRYNRFHTTGICSPSRAALLTGRNHHAAGNGYLSDLPAGFPGYMGRMGPDTATIAQMLRLNGYNSAMFGKDHNVPKSEQSEAGPFDNWPTGRGFEYYYGFIAGDNDQYSPTLFRGISRVAPEENKGDLLDKRLADEIIRYVHNQKAAAPDKPFLIYYAPGSTHAPHQAPADYIARFKGRFDQGWDRMREESYRRQLTMGIHPKGTQLTARPAEIPAWDSLDPQQRAFAARTMEVAAAQLVYQDEQFGRVLDELERMGLLETTLISVILGDNGAAAEAGVEGTVNEMQTVGRHNESPQWLASNIDRMGGPMTYGTYPAGWAWAMDTPFRWTKQVASMLGGIRNGMIMAWKGHVAKPGSICAQFGHLNDIVPTVLEAAGLPAPTSVNGIAQKPIDGKSLLPSLSQCQPKAPRTQYFEIGGKAALYQDGWFASMDDGRAPWAAMPPGGANPPVTWTLYDLERDFSQSTDLSTSKPDRLKAMQATWQAEAERNQVFPLDHRFGAGRAEGMSAFIGGGRRHYEYWGKDISLPAVGQPFLVGRSFTITAQLHLDKPDASGAIMALGSHFGGWSLYLDHGRPSFVFARSTKPEEVARVAAAKALPAGSTSIRLRFATSGFGKPAEVTLSSGETPLAQLSLPVSFLMPAGNGETLDIGQDIGVAVTDYVTPHGRLEGDVRRLTIDMD